MDMTKQIVADIEATPDLLARALKLARLPSFNVAKELDGLRKEVMRELGQKA